MSSSHPYRDIDDRQLWYRAVTWVPPGGLDPVGAVKFAVTPDDRIATMGSCFAQHLSRELMQSGLSYFVAEPAPDFLTPTEIEQRQYGTFSARYGNVYTPAQAEQLLRRATGHFVPQDAAWHRADGRLVDPYRPSVEPAGYADLDQLEADRTSHLAAVRTLFEDTDVLVLTLGLTEAWRARSDGAVYPVAPGVSGGTYDPRLHEFVNFDIDQVRTSLCRFCELAHGLNPALRILLTVSPVPLVATFERRHVLVSTTYSKAVLRVAASAASERFSFVDYFPAYEIVTANSNRDYFAEDFREVDPRAVAHVMRVFMRHYVHGEVPADAVVDHGMGGRMTSDVVCDEDAIAAAVSASR